MAAEHSGEGVLRGVGITGAEVPLELVRRVRPLRPALLPCRITLHPGAAPQRLLKKGKSNEHTEKSLGQS